MCPPITKTTLVAKQWASELKPPNPQDRAQFAAQIMQLEAAYDGEYAVYNSYQPRSSFLRGFGQNRHLQLASPVDCANLEKLEAARAQIYKPSKTVKVEEAILPIRLANSP